jgi:hypothetical protein
MKSFDSDECVATAEPLHFFPFFFISGNQFLFFVQVAPFNQFIVSMAHYKTIKKNGSLKMSYSINSKFKSVACPRAS